MDGCVFYDRVAEHGDLEWLGVRRDHDPAADENEVYVGYSPTDTKFALPVETILTREWDELEAVLTGKRQARVLTHLTRIVGYFSQVHNWNRSKHAELADRRQGGYFIPERLPVRQQTGEVGVNRAKRQPAPAA